MLRWKGDQTEILLADTIVNVVMVDLDPWRIEGMDCKSEHVLNG
jgi:hypothetical protein